MAIAHAEISFVRPQPILIQKYNLSICAIFRNEAPYLKEWIEYHQLIGVDHFYLYNNRSIDRFKKVLEPYVKQGIVTLIDWPDYLRAADEHFWPLSTQVPAYENAIKRSAKHSKWLLFLDIDEFLVLAHDTSLKEILEQHEDAPGLNLQSMFFNASSTGVLPKRRLVIETTELTDPPPPNPEKVVTKMIFKPDLCHQFIWPPYRCLFKEDQLPKEIAKETLRIQRYMTRGQLPSKKPKFAKVDAVQLPAEDLKDLLHSGYEIEERSLDRWLPELKRRMGY